MYICRTRSPTREMFDKNSQPHHHLQDPVTFIIQPCLFREIFLFRWFLFCAYQHGETLAQKILYLHFQTTAYCVASLGCQQLWNQAICPQHPPRTNSRNFVPFAPSQSTPTWEIGPQEVVTREMISTSLPSTFLQLGIHPLVRTMVCRQI